MDSVHRTTVIRDDDGDKITLMHNSDGQLSVLTDGGAAVILDQPAIRALIAAITAVTPGTER